MADVIEIYDVFADDDSHQSSIVLIELIMRVMYMFLPLNTDTLYGVVLCGGERVSDRALYY